MNLPLIYSYEYNEILDLFISSYIKEFGELKFRTILDKVMTSSKISGLISTARYHNIPPSANNILNCLNEIPYFIFSRGQTQAVAALITLERWNEEVNSHQYLLDYDGLKNRAIRILEESKSTFF